jgi:spore germination cell wall hydrolase CwlJ-like protein
VKKTARKAGPARSRTSQEFAIQEKRSAFSEYGPMAFGGMVLVMAFAFAGHYMGQTAVAHNAEPDEVLESMAQPSSNILAKGSLMPEAAPSLRIVNRPVYVPQVITATGKGDFVAPEPAATKKKQDTVVIVPAAIDLKAEDEELREETALAPTRKQVEKAIRLERTATKTQDKEKSKESRKAIAQRRVQMAEENCLARAIYFEARSESELGQIAVAKVILNRVKAPEFPKTICGVVYQGSGRRNSCQFSFACDGLPDDVKSAQAWSKAKSVARRTIAGDAKVAALTTADHYHADYVKPKWAKSMKRLVKIGRHIFYEDS